MPVRLYRPEDTAAVVELSAACARAESDFVLNPMWESAEEFHSEFDRHGIAPEEHLLILDDGEVAQGLSGFLRPYGGHAAGMFCPIVRREERGRGLGGDLLRAALEHGRERLGIALATAGVGTRNRAGYALLTAHGFRPVRQHFVMRCDGDTAFRPPAPAHFELAAAEAQDLPAIHELYRLCGFDVRGPDDLRVLFEDWRHAHAVARRGGKVVAFAELDLHWPRRPWISFVGVSPELRDRGLGSALVAWAVRQRFDAGAQAALLLLSPANRSAVRAYEKVGFRRVRLFDVLERTL